MFVVAGPDSSVCGRFVLHDAPNTFITMVGCFDPKLLEPKQDEMDVEDRKSVV